MASCLLFLVTWCVCVLTCCPTVSYDDTGEFCVAALQLGVPHPPGYPLYVQLMALGRHLPVGSFAFRLNLMGGLWAAFAAVCAVSGAVFAWLAACHWLDRQDSSEHRGR